jgi:replication factor C small subunit
MSYIWYEKYRPLSLDDLELPAKVREQLNRYTQDKDIPHLLFHGPAGGGKTTVAKILLNTIPNQHLLINGSSERSIDVMRETVQKFGSSLPLPGKIKIVFIDEADGLLAPAQKQLRGTIEKCQETCRFIFTCNYLSKILEPIASRFQKIKFHQYQKGSLLKHLIKILKQENVKHNIKDLNFVADKFFPDIRTIINSLQICSVSGTLDLSHLQEIEEELYFKEISEALKMGNLRKIRETVASQHDFTPYYKSLFDIFIYEVPEEIRPNVAVLIGEYLYRDSSVLDKEINFASLCVEIMHSIGCKNITF